MENTNNNNMIEDNNHSKYKVHIESKEDFDKEDYNTTSIIHIYAELIRSDNNNDRQ